MLNFGRVFPCNLQGCNLGCLATKKPWIQLVRFQSLNSCGEPHGQWDVPPDKEVLWNVGRFFWGGVAAGREKPSLFAYPHLKESVIFDDHHL